MTMNQTDINVPVDGTVTSAKLDTNIAIAGTLDVGGVGTFSGNVGIGVTPSASSATTNIELPYGATLSSRSNTAAPQFAMMSNAVGNWYEPTYKINGYATQYTQQGFDGTHVWSTAASGTAGNAITFTPAMTIDASGNLLVGKTTTIFGTAGIALRGTVADFTRDGGTPINVNRLTSDGSLIDFHKAGTIVGSIGSTAGVVSYITLDPRSGGTGLGGTNTDSIIPVTGTGGASDATKDLGLSNIRWRNLYLSGGVYLGGTGAANHLDDYEEGTWTPTAADATSGGNTGTTGVGSYTKIGNTIRVTAALTNVVTTGMTAGNSFYVQGLPFASADIAGASAFFTGGVYTSAVTIASSVLSFMYDNGASALNFYDTDGAILVSDITSGSGDFYFTAIYQTA